MFLNAHLWFSVAGVFFGFFSQTIVGFAASLVSFPFLLQAYTLQQATALLALHYFLFSLILVYKNRRDVDFQVFKTLAPGALLGFVAGVYILKLAQPQVLEKALAVILLLYVANEVLIKKRLILPAYLGWLVGILGGLVSGVVATGSQIFVPYINSKVDSTRVVRATVMAVLAIGNTIRLPLLAYNHLLTRQLFLNSVYLLPVFFLAMFLGQKLFNIINEKLLKLLLLLFLAVSGVSLLLK